MIKLYNITKQYRGKTVLNQVDVTIQKGTCTAVIGPNGVGKTTLLRIILNLEPRYQGNVMIGDLSNRDVRVFKEVGYVQDHRFLYDALTGYDHLMMLAKVHQQSKENVLAICHKLEMEHYLKQKVGTYSLGMKQHLLLAMALVHHPRYLVMDEPFNGLDPTSVDIILRLLQQLKTEGMTLLISSHQLTILANIADDVLLMKGGKLLRVTDVSVASAYYVEVTDKERLFTLLQHGDCRWEKYEEGCILYGEQVWLLNFLIAHQIYIEKWEPHCASLEAVYQHYYHEV